MEGGRGEVRGHAHEKHAASNKSTQVESCSEKGSRLTLKPCMSSAVINGPCTWSKCYTNCMRERKGQQRVQFEHANETSRIWEQKVGFNLGCNARLRIAPP